MPTDPETLDNTVSLGSSPEINGERLLRLINWTMDAKKLMDELYACDTLSDYFKERIKKLL